MEKQTIEVKQIDWFDDHFYKIRYLNEAKVEVETYFPSITTKLGAISKPQLLRWYGDLGTVEAKRRTQEAGERGSRIHWAWYYFTTGGAVVYQPPKAPLYSTEEMAEIYKRFNNQVFVLQNQDEMFDFLKMQRFHEIIKPEEMQSEIKVFNVEHNEAGTADNIFILKEGEYEISGREKLKLEAGLYIFDLKTGRSINEEHFMQVSAYLMCAESMGMGQFKGCLIGHTQAQIRTGIEGFKTYFWNREKALFYYEGYRDIARVWERNFGTKKPVIRQLPALVSLDKDLKWVKTTEKGEQKDGTENRTDNTEKKVQKEKGQVVKTSPSKTQRKNEGTVGSEKQDSPKRSQHK